MKINDNILKETYFSKEEGIRYSSRIHKIYIPEELQNHFIYWMHCSKHGDHAGINRTTNRLKKWLWWPKMRTKVADFISSCLQCIRYKQIQRFQTVREVLSKPEPFELISLDCVGPRKWKEEDRYYLCIIDHYSRYVVLNSYEDIINSRDIIDCMKNKWLPYFHCPMAVLTDRGGEFISKAFEDFIVNEVGAIIIRTSHYYPQGDSINEAAHRMINNTISLLEAEVDEFEEYLRLEAMLNNTSPHAATDNTPFFFLYGFEATLPGWQGLQHQNKSLEIRNLSRKTEQIKVVYRNLLMQEKENYRIVKIDLKIND